MKETRWGDRIILGVVAATVILMLAGFWVMARFGVDGLAETHRAATREALVDYYRFNKRFPKDGVELANSMKRTHAFLRQPIEANAIQVVVEKVTEKECTISVTGRSALGKWRDEATVTADEATREIAQN